MGKKDKHKLGSSRNNPIFKVANGKLKQKNKPKEVTTKLKKVRNNIGFDYQTVFLFILLIFHYRSLSKKLSKKSMIN